MESQLTKEYQNPICRRIVWEGNEQLYKMEEKTHLAFQTAAYELGRILGHTSQQFWTHTMPEALYTFIDSWETGSARAACEAWLERNPRITKE